jgi:hypothetical protein
MKLNEIDSTLAEFSLRDVISTINLGRGISKLDPDQAGRDATNWIFNKKIPDEIDKYGQRRQQEKRQQQQKQQQQRRRRTSKMDGGFLK